MTLKLPEPLPYDYVDELLDNEYVYASAFWDDVEDDLGNVFEEKTRIAHVYCRRIDEDGEETVSNFANPMFEVKSEFDYTKFTEDDEGYVNFPHRLGWIWTAEPWTKKEMNAWLMNHEEDEDDA